MKKRKTVLSYMTEPGWYILSTNQITIKRLDGADEIIRPFHIVQRIRWIDCEGVLGKLRRLFVGEVLIKLPAPGVRFAAIDKRKFEKNFKRVKQPRSRWD